MFIPVLFHRISFEGIISTWCMGMVLMSSMMLALTGVKLYSPNSFPLLQMTPLILPTVSFTAEKKTFMVMLLNHVARVQTF